MNLASDLNLVADEYSDLVSGARRWLLAHADLTPVTEEVRRYVHGEQPTTEILVVKHFTASWVVRALVETGTDPGHTLVRQAIASVLSNRKGTLWRWETGEYPIWMTYQGLVACLRGAVILTHDRTTSEHF
jgi:hypothetical protein